MSKEFIKEINIICVGDIRYRFDAKNIYAFDFEFKPDILRIDFKDNSFIEYNKNNIICVEVCK